MSPSNPEEHAGAKQPMQPPALWSGDAARLSRSIGAARRIPLGSSGENAFLEVLPAIDLSRPGSAGGLSLRTALRCRAGRLLLGSGGVAMLCLLGGVPLPHGGDAAKERLRASAAVARLPRPLDSLHFSLEPAAGDLRGILEHHAPDPLIHQRLHVRREDVSVHCDAWAGMNLWKALLAHAGGIEPAHDLSIDELPLQFAFRLGRVHAPAAALSSLATGDVVRMPLWLDIAGEGVVRIAGRLVTLRCARESASLRFVVLAVDDEPASPPHAKTSPVFSLPTSHRRSNHIAMNNHPFSMPSPMATPSHSDAERPPAGRPAASPDPLDDVSILLTAEVGTLTLSVGALKQLAPGVVFDIDPYGNSEVVLCASNGHQVASGRLVDIDGYLGIQIVRVGAA